MRILVTGGAGFIGSHVVERFAARGDEVVILDSFDSFYPPDVKRRNIASVMTSGRVALVEGDICDYRSLAKAFERPEIAAVVHLAARAGVRPSLERPLDYLRTNVEGTAALLETAREYGVSSFVLGSSSSVYGDSTPGPFREDAPAVDPISPYAASKRAAELVCRTYSHLYGMRVAALRLFTVYGPRQRPDLAIHKFARLMMRGHPIPLFGDGRSERDYTYVDDIVNGIEAAVDWIGRQEPGTFEIVNLGEQQTTSLAVLVDLIANELGVKPGIDWQPAQPGDVLRTFASVEKAAKLLGYQPSTSMKEGITRFADWFRKQPAS